MLSGSVLIPTPVSGVRAPLPCTGTGIGEVERSPALGNSGPLFPASPRLSLSLILRGLQGIDG